MASAVIEDAGVALAVEVLEGGEHRHARAVELAEMLLRAAADQAPETGEGRG